MNNSFPRNFRKKPVVIEAIQLKRHNIRDVLFFIDGSRVNTDCKMSADRWEEYQDKVIKEGLIVKTLEGQHIASMGDYIIKGVKGENYPCKPDIFEMTYEDVVEDTAPTAQDHLTRIHHIASAPMSEHEDLDTDPLTVRMVNSLCQSIRLHNKIENEQRETIAALERLDKDRVKRIVFLEQKTAELEHQLEIGEAAASQVMKNEEAAWQKVKELEEDNQRLAKQYEEEVSPMSDRTPCSFCEVVADMDRGIANFKRIFAENRIAELEREKLFERERVEEWATKAQQLERENAELKDYKQAIDDALTCWELIGTGSAKKDLNTLLTIEGDVALDPKVSDKAREGQRTTAERCMRIIGEQKTGHEAISAIRAEFGGENEN